MHQAQCTAAQKWKRGSNGTTEQASSLIRLIPLSGGNPHRNVLFKPVMLYLIYHALYTTGSAFLGELVFVTNSRDGMKRSLCWSKEVPLYLGEATNMNVLRSFC